MAKGAFGVIVDAARRALEKAAQLAEQGSSEVVFKDLLGNILNAAAVAALAGDEEALRGTDGRSGE